MPMAPLRPCAGCGHVLVPKGRCAACARAVEQRRGTAAERGYDAWWRPRRDQFLREFPLCGMRPGGQPPVMSRCWEEGRVTPATQVDHVVPHRGDRQLFEDRDHNWQALCASCGSRKSQAGL